MAPGEGGPRETCHQSPRPDIPVRRSGLCGARMGHPDVGPMLPPAEGQVPRKPGQPQCHFPSPTPREAEGSPSSRRPCTGDTLVSHTQTRTHMHTHRHMQAHTRTHMRARTHTHMHTHACTHTHTRGLPAVMLPFLCNCQHSTQIG